MTDNQSPNLAAETCAEGMKEIFALAEALGIPTENLRAFIEAEIKKFYADKQ